MANFLQTAGEIWRRMGFLQRVVLLTVLLACGAAAALLVGWVRRPHLALLYAGLEPQEAARIVERVREAGVAYELQDGGTSVYVEADTVYGLRLDLAGEGLPTGGHQGYSILDKESIGTSPFTQRVNYQRAIEGELARTIALLEGVSGARVHIVQPERKLFRAGKQGATATVVLRLKPGWRLTAGNVAAVVHLVAGSVQDCRPEQVVVVDAAGDLLSGEMDDGFARGAGTLLDYKTQVETYLARKAEDMLALVLGPGRATVKVDAKIETSSVNQTVEKYDPDTKVAKKEEITVKDVRTGGGGGGAGAGAGASVDTTKEETTLMDYALSRTVEETINMPGKILSLSVAAFVDLSGETTPTAGEAAADGGEGAPTPAAAAPKLAVEDAEEIIRNAVGLTETDTLKVVSVPFRRPEAPAAAPEEDDLLASPQFYMDLAQHASLGILVVGALLTLKIFGGARKKLAAEGGEGRAQVAPGGGGATVNLLAGGSAGGLPGNGDLKGRITAALQENPEEVKRLFRAWVEGDGGNA